ncbi:hypothetical protein HK102_007093, partial [Quaeritorhiza haematococci]
MTDFVYRTLSPLVTVLTSPDVEASIKRHNFPSFVDFIAPFGLNLDGKGILAQLFVLDHPPWKDLEHSLFSLYRKVTARDSQGQANSIDTPLLRFHDATILDRHTSTSSLSYSSPTTSFSLPSSSPSSSFSLPSITTASTATTTLGTPLTPNSALSGASIPPSSFTLPTVNTIIASCLKRYRQDIHHLGGSEHSEVGENDTPWYDEYREIVCGLIGTTEHETFNHPLACLIVVTTANPDPVSTLAKLYNPSNPPPGFAKVYLDPNVLRYYLLVHDPSMPGANPDPNNLLLQMKKTFGLSCQLITISGANTDSGARKVNNIWDVYLSEKRKLLRCLAEGRNTPGGSTGATGRRSSSTTSISKTSEDSFLMDTSSPLAPFSNPGLGIGNADSITKPPEEETRHITLQDDDWWASNVSDEMMFVQCGSSLVEEDVKAVDQFVRDLLVQNILPYMERNVQHWNEQVAASRRGITGRIFNVGRKYFGTGNKSNTQITPIMDPSGFVVYPYNAPEFLMRKLADYSFMLRDYRFAYSVYDSVRKDFQNNEKAAKYYAGTQ